MISRKGSKGEKYMFKIKEVDAKTTPRKKQLDLKNIWKKRRNYGSKK